MRRLLRFFTLMALRVVAVSTIILWGVSKVSLPWVALPIANSSFTGIGTTTDGVALIFSSPLPPSLYGVSETRSTMNQALGENAYSFLGQFFFQAVRQPAQPRIVLGASYPAALVSTILLYGIIEYMPRRRARLKK